MNTHHTCLMTNIKGFKNYPHSNYQDLQSRSISCRDFLLLISPIQRPVILIPAFLQVLVNGPGTCIPICFAAFFFRCRSPKFVQTVRMLLYLSKQSTITIDIDLQETLSLAGSDCICGEHCSSIVSVAFRETFVLSSNSRSLFCAMACLAKSMSTCKVLRKAILDKFSIQISQ